MEFHIYTLGWFFVNLHKCDKKDKCKIIIIFYAAYRLKFAVFSTNWLQLL
jgi:hypothetical protein